MKIYFIQHSSFLAETESALYLFDYFGGKLPIVNREKPLFVLASHSHDDHFSTEVFEAVGNFHKVSFILSSDISKTKVPELYQKQTVFVSPYQNISYEFGEIRTLQSTDLGVAFLIKEKDQTIYHAGDLNSWVWQGASPYQNEQMISLYQSEIQKLKGEKIDVAFMLLDPRQEENYALGMTLLLEEVNPKIVVPMHMWGDFSVVPKFKKEFPQYAERMLMVQKEGDFFEI